MHKYEVKSITNVKGFMHGNISKEFVQHFYDETCDLVVGEYSPVYPISIENIGITEPDPNYFIRRSARPNFVLECVTDGTGHIECNGKHFVVRAGDVYILEPFTTQFYYADPEDPFRKLWINCRGKNLAAIYSALELSGVTHFPQANCLDIFEKIHALEHVSLLNRDIWADAMELILQLFTRLSKNFVVNAADAKIPKEVREIKRRLDNSVFTNISLDELCNELALSRATLINKFKAYYGCTPHKYLMQTKLRFASIALRTEECRIESIAARLGFSDEYYFSKAFKKQFGVSPGAYRKK